MKTLLIVIVSSVLFLSSCNTDKSKITGVWKVKTFSINNQNFDKFRLSSINDNIPTSIQFFDNGFFSLKININSSGYSVVTKRNEEHTYEDVWKGKWKLNMLSKIEIEFIDMNENIGVQFGKYDLSVFKSIGGQKNRLLINTKGENDFMYLELYQ